MKIAIGADHAGFELKEKLKAILGDKYEWDDCGTFGAESVDYPDYAHAVANKVALGECNCGILICGSGNGVCMTANKHEQIRAALCWMPEIAALAKQHNNANVICLPARYLDDKTAIETVEAYLNSDFEGGRHQRRVDKIDRGEA